MKIFVFFFIWKIYIILSEHLFQDEQQQNDFNICAFR